MKWKIGNIELKNQICLAPMAGISDVAYMKICEEMGAAYVTTELISAEAIVRNNKKTLEMLDGLEELNIPVAVQIFGNNKEVLSRAAKIICDLHKASIIDINMGCPVPKIAVSSKSGSYLLKDPKTVYEIVSSVKQAINIPVTVKIRSGWDNSSINALEIAKEIERAGASCITIHPRTRTQGYSGKADWNIIKEIKENVNIPVIGNGDVTSCILAKKMLDETKCDAVMIGRGVLGNPWLIHECVTYLETNQIVLKPSLEERKEMMLKHYKLLSSSKGEKRALLEIRMHVLYYVKGLKNSTYIKNRICKCSSSKEIFNVINEYFNSLNNL